MKPRASIFNSERSTVPGGKSIQYPTKVSPMFSGLVPVENSQAGSINDVYDLLRQHDLFVIGEFSHEVNQCLLCLKGQKLEDIKRVISHPQALAQSDVFLRELNVEVVATYDTAGSAKMLRNEQLMGVAAIAAA